MSHKILVADGSPTVRNVAESLLRKRGYEVILVDDGAKALSIAKTDKPDFIFLDNSMSVLNGDQVLRELKQNRKLKNVPVIMLLSEDEMERKQELKQVGVDAFIIKPFNPKDILDHVKGLLEKETSLPPEDEIKATEKLPFGEDEKSEEKETEKTAPPKGKKKSEDTLNIVETSELMESFEASDQASDEEEAHGFDWFMYELKKETPKHEKADTHLERKPIVSEQEIPDKKTDQKQESKIYKIDEHEKGYEDFLKDLKRELKEPDKEKSILVKPPATEEVSRSGFDHLISDLKEKISERVAQEVAKKITPEFLENIIREEIAKLEHEKLSSLKK